MCNIPSLKGGIELPLISIVYREGEMAKPTPFTYLHEVFVFITQGDMNEEN